MLGNAVSFYQPRSLIIGQNCNTFGNKQRLLKAMKDNRTDYHATLLSNYTKIACVATFFFTFVCGSTSCQRVDEDLVSKSIVTELTGHFFFREVLEMVDKHRHRESVRAYFDEDQSAIRFIGSEDQNGLLVDGYEIRGDPSILGISLYFYGNEQLLVMVNVAISPEAESKAHHLIQQTLDSVDAPGRGRSKAGRLYFLGLYPLGPDRVIKIMVRKDEVANGSLYSINYAISVTT